MPLSPIRLLPPHMLITNDVYDLAVNLVLPNVGVFGVNQNKSSILNPDGISESRWKLDEHCLFVGQSTGVEAVSFSFDNARDRLSGCQDIWGGRCFFGG